VKFSPIVEEFGDDYYKDALDNDYELDTTTVKDKKSTFQAKVISTSNLRTSSLVFKPKESGSGSARKDLKELTSNEKYTPSEVDKIVAPLIMPDSAENVKHIEEQKQSTVTPISTSINGKIEELKQKCEVAKQESTTSSKNVKHGKTHKDDDDAFFEKLIKCSKDNHINKPTIADKPPISVATITDPVSCDEETSQVEILLNKMGFTNIMESETKETNSQTLVRAFDNCKQYLQKKILKIPVKNRFDGLEIDEEDVLDDDNTESLMKFDNESQRKEAISKSEITEKLSLETLGENIDLDVATRLSLRDALINSANEPVVIPEQIDVTNVHTALTAASPFKDGVIMDRDINQVIRNITEKCKENDDQHFTSINLGKLESPSSVKVEEIKYSDFLSDKFADDISIEPHLNFYEKIKLQLATVKEKREKLYQLEQRQNERIRALFTPFIHIKECFVSACSRLAKGYQTIRCLGFKLSWSIFRCILLPQISAKIKSFFTLQGIKDAILQPIKNFYDYTNQILHSLGFINYVKNIANSAINVNYSEHFSKFMID